MGTTRANREFFEEALQSSLVVRPENIWSYIDKIPTDGPSVQKIKENKIFTWHKSETEPAVPLVKYYDKYQLTAVDAGTNNSFIIVDDDIKEQENGPVAVTGIIPFNFAEDFYSYELYMPDGKTQIPFGVGDWIVDIHSGILTFFGEVPEGIDAAHPPLLSFFKYTGSKGFINDDPRLESAVLPINNFYLEKGTTSFTKESVNGEDEGRTLYQIIDNACNTLVSDQFINMYGWDGADDNVGIALGWEKVLPLNYTASRDPVKGYDSSKNSQIGVVLSNKRSEFASVAFSELFSVVYTSEKVQIADDVTYTLAVSGTTLSLTKESSTPGIAPEVLYSISISNTRAGDFIKLYFDPKDKTKGFIFLQRGKKALADEQSELRVISSIASPNEDTTDDVTALLVYWDTEKADFLPFVTKESDYFDFGFPVVVPLGTIKPSLSLDNVLLSSFDDIITPDYYGPRVATLVLASEDSVNIKSSDYVVKNQQYWRLDEVLNIAIAKYEDEHEGKTFSGKVILREGNYFLSDNWKINRDVAFVGEGKVVIHSEEKEVSTDSSLVTFNNITFDKVSKIVTISGASVFTEITATDTELDLSSVGLTRVENSSFKTVLVEGNTVRDSEKGVITTFLHNVIAPTVTVERENTSIADCSIGLLTITTPGLVLVHNCFITTIHGKKADTFLEGNYITQYSETENSEQIPVASTKENTSGRFPIYSKDDHKHRKYAEFSWPFSYNEANQSIDLLYDEATLEILPDGKLKVCAKADSIKMPDNSVFDRGANAYDIEKSESLKPMSYDSDDSLMDVFTDLWTHKADLNKAGKIPLQQLPDSVSYGGLLYVGTWSFDDNNGEYPTLEDLSKEFDRDIVVDEVQPGWFFIVSPPSGTTEEDTVDGQSNNKGDNPVKIQTAVTRPGEEKGLEFTAGDWVICSKVDKYQGAISWEKIDRAYSDPIYSILPATANVPDKENLPWYWKNDARGGALDLSNDTILEAFDKINLQLKKLEPKKPANIKDLKLVVKDIDSLPTFSFRTIATSGAVNDEVKSLYDNSKIDFVNFGIKDNGADYKNLAYFGDSAVINVSVLNPASDPEAIFTQDVVLSSDNVSETYLFEKDGEVEVSTKNEPFADADHGENFWNGVDVSFKVPVNDDGSYKVSATISEVKVNGDMADQDAKYNQSTSGSFKAYTPYIPDTLSPIISEKRFTTPWDSSNLVSGVRCMSLKHFGFPRISVTVPNVSDGKVPTGSLADLTVYLGTPDDVVVKTVDISKYISYRKNTTTPYYDMLIDINQLPLDTDIDTDRVIESDFSFVFVANIYDVYNEPHKVELFRTDPNLYRFDPTTESERLTLGSLSNDSELAKEIQNDITFGATWPFEGNTCDAVGQKNNLMKKGRNKDGTVVSEYQFPEGSYKFMTTLGEDTSVDYSNFEGEVMENGDFYAGACFKFEGNDGKLLLNSASGFTLQIDVEDDVKDEFKYDSLTGATKDLILQCCIVSSESEGGQSHWFDCNKAANGFKSPINFKDPVMYAGLSNSLTKRITFGKALQTGNVYIRIGLKKGSKMKFTGVRITEVI